MVHRSTFTGEQTAEQRRAQEAMERERETMLRKFNNGLKFWRMCETPLCRRRRRCSGDAQACRTRHWQAMPEEVKEYWRGALTAAKTTRSPQELHRAGLAASDAYLQSQAQIETRLGGASEAAPAPAAPAVRAPAPRIRRL